MPVLIDAYNLLHAWQADPSAPEGLGRAMLCRLLGDWSARRGKRVTAVFDGAAPPKELAAQLGDARIQIVYAAPRTADAVIADLVGQSSAPRRLLVVSSDHEVQRAAKRRQAAFTDSVPFAERLLRDLARPGSPATPDVKQQPEAADDAQRRAWLAEFGVDPDSDDLFEHP